MNIWKTLSKLWGKATELAQDLLAPEDKKIEKLLAIDPGTMRLLLPKSPANIKDIFVLFDYGNNVVRTIVKSIKYKNNAGLRKRIAGFLHEELVEISSEITLFEGAPPILMPMPMSKEEKRKKGFNQCEELCKEIQRINSNLEISYNALKKIMETKRQTTLGRDERILNVVDSMEAENKIVKNKTIIVLDDVYTTLASFSEARRALLEAGARRVIGLFIAH